MKKIVLLTAALVSLASMASAASVTIVGSKHDLSTNASWVNGTGKQICIFCHTPHNAVPSVPLWNRTNHTASSITKFYNSSPTLSGTATNFKATGGTPTTFASDSVSLMCLSCHDGSTAPGAYQNRAVAAEAGTDTGLKVTGKANIGGDTDQLSNDHPIGFSYTAAQAQETDRLFDTATANANLGGNAFFGTTKELIECSSCHKVHDNQFSPFLRTSNVGSKLCLACHNK